MRGDNVQFEGLSGSSDLCVGGGGVNAGGCGRGTADFSTARVRVRLADLGSRDRPSPGQWGSVGSVSWYGEGFSPVREENPPQTARKPSTRTERGTPRGRYLRAHALQRHGPVASPHPRSDRGRGTSGLPIQLGNAPQTNPRRPTAADRRQSAPPPHRVRRGRSGSRQGAPHNALRNHPHIEQEGRITPQIAPTAQRRRGQQLSGGGWGDKREPPAPGGGSEGFGWV